MTEPRRLVVEPRYWWAEMARLVEGEDSLSYNKVEVSANIHCQALQTRKRHVYNLIAIPDRYHGINFAVPRSITAG